MAKTNNGLVTYAKAQVGLPYWFGCYGNIATQSLLNSKRKQYPSNYKDTDFESQIGKRVHDCVGLIKGYLWSESTTATPKYNSAQDVSAAGMYSKSTTKGTISSIPQKAGILVYKAKVSSKPSTIHHVGVYDGSGYIYEAKGHKYGVVKSKLDSSWTHWSECPFLTYETATTTATKATTSYYPKYTGTSVSIVVILQVVGEKDLSFLHRKAIATANGITNYSGSSVQNLQMVALAKAGRLVKA